MQKESKYLEYKEDLTKTYLKTVSAFANYNDGVIIFGIDDDLRIIGVKDVKNACLNIENQINDSIKPRPVYSIRVNEDKTISLFIKKGLETPYRYNGKCYVRNDSSTIEVDSIGENRLVLEGMNLSFEELKSKKQDLKFDILSKLLKEKLELENFNIDTLKSLNLYSNTNGYNNAAALLSDNNDFSGLDIIVFGKNINEIKKRYNLSNMSILNQYQEALNIYKEEYIIEKIGNGYRSKYELIPFNAYREVIANSLIHRVWDISSSTKVEMFEDKIIVSSPGGLLPEISKDEFLNGNFSCLRNPIIANVFHRLEIVEIFATGIKRINEAYEESFSKPIFDIFQNSIKITLPLLTKVTLSEKEEKVYSVMKNNYQYKRQELEKMTNLSKDTIIRVLNNLLDYKLITKIGQAKNVTYLKK